MDFFKQNVEKNKAYNMILDAIKIAGTMVRYNPPTREEIISELRSDEVQEFKNKMYLIRTSSLTEEEKKKQRDDVRKEFIRIMNIYK